VFQFNVSPIMYSAPLQNLHMICSLKHTCGAANAEALNPLDDKTVRRKEPHMEIFSVRLMSRCHKGPRCKFAYKEARLCSWLHSNDRRQGRARACGKEKAVRTALFMGTRKYEQIINGFLALVLSFCYYFKYLWR